MISTDRAQSGRSGRNDERPNPTTSFLSLPKGGGAISGLGEKFAANPVTGTGSLTVPIAVSPGRDGFAPALSLRYDSGAGQGPFGFGWRLDLPNITRKTDRGLPKYDDAGESDVYILSGHEDLVPVLGPDGQPLTGQPDVPGYTVHYYRPRVEGLFARIERWVRDANGDVHWRSMTTDNTLNIYGIDENSRIADPSDPRRIYSWLICETRDARGNAIWYTYKAENGQGLDLARAHERHRGAPDAPARAANRYPKRIRYGNCQPLLDSEGRRPALLDRRQLEEADWKFDVVFDYGEHDPEAPTPDEPHVWLCRRDPFSTYRAGFEVRTCRLCRRVLVFHHFPEEPGVGTNGLVRSTDFAYRETPAGSFLTQITQTGYKRRQSENYEAKSLPPLEFEYSQPVLGDQVEEADAESMENLPFGVDGAVYRWIDLDGEGLPGVLAEQGGGWYYKRNQSALGQSSSPAFPVEGAVSFAPLESVSSRPAGVSLLGGKWRFLDLAGDGQLDAVRLDAAQSGFYERNASGGWEPYRSFAGNPNVDWSRPDVQLADLTGDGHADLLIMDGDELTWHASLGEAGFDGGLRVSLPDDEERGPRVLFSSRTEMVVLADFSGDGLSDLVRIRNGEICYWPNLGYGRFGAKITMDDAPWFDAPDQFDPGRIRLADIDGSGVTDMLYLGRNGTRIWFNEAGNSWSSAHELLGFPPTDNTASVEAVDLLGNGTACLVWSSPLPSSPHGSLKYIRLMKAGKPHLLVKIRNNLGAETTIRYAPSTHFYLRDRQAGRPWITRLPFPVHTVERIETIDHVGRNRYVTRYAYHHGYYDGVEREFRGFGMVEQWDTEALASPGGPSPADEADNWNGAYHVPPAYTRTWYHTGFYRDHQRISRLYAEEYYRPPGLTGEEAEALLLPDTSLPPGLTAEEMREACRALKGSMLRQEVYALDGTPAEQHPYTVTEQTFTVRRLQPAGDLRHGVFHPFLSESVTWRYERNPDDPRITHRLILETDDFGNVLKEAEAAYGRRTPDPELPEIDRRKQSQTLVTYTERSFTRPIGALPGAYVPHYRAPLPAEVSVFELTGFTPTGPAGRFRTSDLGREESPGSGGRLDTHGETNPEETPGSGKERRLVERERTLYRSDDLSSLLPVGKAEPMALPGERYRLAFTQELIAQVYQRAGNPLMDAAAEVLESREGDGGGYVSGKRMKEDGLFPANDPDEHWWIPSGRVFFSPEGGDSPAEELAYARKHFFRPCRCRDPFHTDQAPKETIVVYDKYDLLVEETRDPLGNRTTAGIRSPAGERDPSVPGNDYRTLQPFRIMDANRNCLEAAFDALGFVVGTAVSGKPEERIGDSLEGFDPDLPEEKVREYAERPLDHAHALLGDAASRTVYDLHAYMRTKNRPRPDPPVVSVIARETHASDTAPGSRTEVQITFTYADGLGREIQTKTLSDSPSTDGAEARWIGSGWVVLNNKGNPVRQFEPFFTAHHRYESHAINGASSVLFYDPVGRVAATLYPNDTYSKTVYDPWREKVFDANDTSAPRGEETGDPRTDRDIRGMTAEYFASLTAPWRTWHEQRIGGELGAREQEAARKAADHANTPTVQYVDALGRVFLIRQHNGADDEGRIRWLDRRVDLDIRGNPLAISDTVRQDGAERARIVVNNRFDLAGNRIHRLHMDAGERWTLPDATGRPIRLWDGRGHRFRTEYDRLRRLRRLYVIGADPGDPNREMLIERNVYGEQHPEAEARSLRGQLYLQLDSSGLTACEACDFKGNVLRAAKRLANNYRETIDWSAADAALPAGDADALDISAVEAAVEPFLEREVFTSLTAYDALNREVSITSPHTPAMTPGVIRPAYNRANLLTRVDVRLSGGDWTPFVRRIAYDAKGQRKRIDYGNGASTVCDYDPLTFRLVRLVTTRDRSKFPGDCPDPRDGGWPGCHLQNLHYTYDPAGNIVHIRDDAQQTIYFRNRRVEASASFTYDPAYRLVEATGREHVGQPGGHPRIHSPHDEARTGLRWSANDGNAMAPYIERYVYDDAGNLLEMRHLGGVTHAGWTRHFEYGEKSMIEDVAAPHDSNRLSAVRTGNSETETERFVYDAHGNMIRMPHLGGAHPGPNMHWDCRDRLIRTDLGGGGTAFYVYDGAGQRVRKVWEKSPSLIEERLYFAGFEIFRRRTASDGIVLERETLHVMADKLRIAMVETRTVDKTGSDPAPERLIRYPFSNHLGSACVELDHEANIISYEEYTPFGSSSYQAVRSVQETPKRYRFTGKERDRETGMYYYGARYYAPWLGRWTSCDPVENMNRYEYVRNNPLRFEDPDGNEESEAGARLSGALRMLGGAAQLVAGGLALLAPEPTMVTKVVGGIAVVNGADDLLTGTRQLITGRREQGAIETAVSATAQAMGMSEESADALGSGVNAGLGFVSPSGPISGGPRFGMAMATAGSRETAVVVAVSADTARVAEHARSAQIASNAIETVHMMASSSGGGSSGTGGSASASPSPPASGGGTGGSSGGGQSQAGSAAPGSPQPEYTPNPRIRKHGEQPSPRPGKQSHHPESQTALRRHIANYNPNDDPTLLMSTQDHYRTYAPQAAQRRRGEAYYRELGTSAALEEAAQIIHNAGETMETAGQAALEHAGYLFKITPLDKVLQCLPPGH